YKDHKYIPVLAYSTATLVGLSRIHDNMHWTSDVLAGAAVGYLSAKGVLLLYDFTERKLRKRKNKLLVTPQVAPKVAGLQAVYTF
ncbi:MAG: phosphatase PAP2 family protein, partial [Hymenobacteraceae bacterium]|nr:phosphatase PAP2 family protein [Hymenobacteraceae bacterium]MDX5512361.1 phosphatase PAP2 family protein [Hymenobacteraceae bacterium]